MNAEILNLIVLCRLNLPLWCASVERSFSMEKNLFNDRRRSLTVENLEMSVVFHYFLTNPRVESA